MTRTSSLLNDTPLVIPSLTNFKMIHTRRTCYYASVEFLLCLNMPFMPAWGINLLCGHSATSMTSAYINFHPIVAINSFFCEKPLRMF